MVIQAQDIAPQVSWGTSPEQVAPVNGAVPDPASFADSNKALACKSALSYMGLEAGTPITDIRIDYAFIGSCTNARIEDFRSAAIFIDAGWEWRDPGCSMCLAMNDDQLEVGQRCASTSNRNFEGRQGKGGRTHLVSPAMAAAAAAAGHFVDIRK